MTEIEIPTEQQKKRRVFFRRLAFGFLAVVFFVFCFVSFCLFVSIVPASNFPSGTIFEIPDGATLSETATMLEEKGIVRSAFLLRAEIALLKNNRPVISGFYLFQKKESLVQIAERIVVGEYRIERVKILIPEGFEATDIEKTLVSAMPAFDDAKFLSLAKKNEGYLFPDTYFFFVTETPEDVIAKMRANFDEKIKTLDSKINASGHSFAEIVIMASLIERETVTPVDRRIVSGILWKRIRLNMPLQVDAAFNYINGKSTYALTASDLRIDSPYNTYARKGLPAGPISNPGLDAILASLEPTETPYLYYLSEKNGTMHYAKTFEEHKKNKVKYFR